MRQLTSLDTQFLAVEDGRAHGHVTGLGIYDPSTGPLGRLTREDVRDLVASRIHLLAPLYSRLAKVPFDIDYPYWTPDPELDLDRHVIGVELAPGAGTDELAQLVAQIAAQRLERSRPLWELHVIQGLPDGRVGVVTKLHHSAIDGVSGEELIATLLDLEPAAATSTPPPLITAAAPSAGEMFLRGLVNLPRQPVRAAESIGRALPHLDQVPNLGALPGVGAVASTARFVRSRFPGTEDGRLLNQSPPAVPRTRFNARISGERSLAFAKLSLAEVKQIKNHFDVTVNDVVMAIVSGALREWMSERAELPETGLVSLVPISVRGKDEEGTFGNQIGMLLAALPTDQPDRVTRVRAAGALMRSAKMRHRAVPATLLQDANHFIPPAVFARSARALMRVATQPGAGVSANLLVSNIPGSPVPLYMAGARLEAQYPVSAIFHGLGLNITVLSYLDGMDWGVVCDDGQDAWSLMAAIEAEQAALLALT